MFTAGIALALFVVIHLIRNSIENWVSQHSDYLLIYSTPMLEFPAATPLPTLTVTPVPTALPPPLAPIRLSIPVINLNISIQEIFPTEKLLTGGESRLVWELPPFAVGHYDSSGSPGGGRNIVLIGHNNTEGEVFRDLDKLQLEDDVTLFTEQSEFHYRVQKKYLIPYLGAELEGDRKLQSFAEPQSSEMITMISCWPYATNSHRIVIIAIPLDDGNS